MIKIDQRCFFFPEDFGIKYSHRIIHLRYEYQNIQNIIQVFIYRKKNNYF